jgi:hypothetical protein
MSGQMFVVACVVGIAGAGVFTAQAQNANHPCHDKCVAEQDKCYKATLPHSSSNMPPACTAVFAQCESTCPQPPKK